MAQGLVAMNYYEGEHEISPRLYNLLIGGVLLYGFALNAYFCYAYTDWAYRILYGSPTAFLFGYFICVVAGTLLVVRSRNPVVSFLGYNLVVLPVGLLVSGLVASYSTYIVFEAFILTAGATVIFIAAGSIWPDFFLSLGRVLLFSLFIIVIGELILTFFFRTTIGALDYLVAAVFCFFIGYDWAVANRRTRTIDNAIDSACALYLDIINLFIRILAILGRGNGRGGNGRH